MKLKIGKAYINERGHKVKILGKIKGKTTFVGLSNFDDQVVQLFKVNGKAVHSVGSNYNIDRKWSKK